MSASRTGALAWTERMAASAMARAARASWPVTAGVVLSRTHGAAADVAGGDHPGRAEHLAPDVVAVGGLETRLGGGHRAGLTALRQGEVPQYTSLLEDSRRHAIDRMIDNARLLGANAIVAMRFDSSEISQQLTEIVAYGTAVVVRPTG